MYGTLRCRPYRALEVISLNYGGADIFQGADIFYYTRNTTQDELREKGCEEADRLIFLRNGRVILFLSPDI